MAADGVPEDDTIFSNPLRLTVEKQEDASLPIYSRDSAQLSAFILPRASQLEYLTNLPVSAM
jgi:hypothetical protein